jgi:hypothetical protein
MPTVTTARWNENTVRLRAWATMAFGADRRMLFAHAAFGAGYFSVTRITVRSSGSSSRRTLGSTASNGS